MCGDEVSQVGRLRRERCHGGILTLASKDEARNRSLWEMGYGTCGAKLIEGR